MTDTKATFQHLTAKKSTTRSRVVD